jgi:hypothetical protein
MGGSSSLVLGKSSSKNVSSHEKTNNGVGSAYGDGSFINMSPQHSKLSDGDIVDASPDQEKFYENIYTSMYPNSSWQALYGYTPSPDSQPYFYRGWLPYQYSPPTPNSNNISQEEDPNEP